MPLKQGYSEKTLHENIDKMVREGYSQARASAAAYREARKSWRKKHPVGHFPAHLAKKTGTKKRTIKKRVVKKRTQVKRSTNPIKKRKVVKAKKKTNTTRWKYVIGVKKGTKKYFVSTVVNGVAVAMDTKAENAIKFNLRDLAAKIGMKIVHAHPRYIVSVEHASVR